MLVNRYGFNFLFFSQKAMRLSPKVSRYPLYHIPNVRMYLGLLASFLFCSPACQTWGSRRSPWPTTGWREPVSLWCFSTVQGQPNPRRRKPIAEYLTSAWSSCSPPDWTVLDVMADSATPVIPTAPLRATVFMEGFRGTSRPGGRDSKSSSWVTIDC